MNILRISVPAPQNVLPITHRSPVLGRSDIYGDVQGILQSWGGFPVLSRLTTELPTIDVFLAGGVLRDVLLRTERPPKDFDFFVDGPDLDSVLGILGSHGTVIYGPFGSPRWAPSGARLLRQR